MNRVRFGAIGLALALVPVALGAQGNTTIEGTLVDSKCYLSDTSLTANDHGTMKECGTMCLKGGTPAAVITRDGKFHPIIAASIALAPHVGQTVRVNGALHNGAVLAKKVEIRKNGRWEEVKLGAMM